MHQSDHKSPVDHVSVNGALTKLVGLACTLFTMTALSADISGRMTNDVGEPLNKVPVCLATSHQQNECAKIRWTSKKGGYTFRGVKSSGKYLVRVFQDTSASARKYQTYATYVWAPRVQAVTINRKGESLTVDDFVGKFNFSNFQRILSLTAADFPDLANIDVASSYVALKVFIPSQSDNADSETIFLGQVTNPDTVFIEASIPLSVTEIGYEIFSETLALSGTIILKDA